MELLHELAKLNSEEILDYLVMPFLLAFCITILTGMGSK